jgi:hypothetical protein
MAFQLIASGYNDCTIWAPHQHLGRGVSQTTNKQVVSHDTNLVIQILSFFGIVWLVLLFEHGNAGRAFL